MRRVTLIAGIVLGITLLFCLVVFITGLCIAYGSPYKVSRANQPFWQSMGIVFILGSLILLYWYLPRLPARPAHQEHAHSQGGQEQKDTGPTVEQLLQQAHELYTSGRMKEAYARIAQAIRLRYRELLDLDREITNSELLAHLSHHGLPYKAIQQCLNTCTLVEFADYAPPEKTFKSTLDTARRVCLKANASQTTRKGASGRE